MRYIKRFIFEILLIIALITKYLALKEILFQTIIGIGVFNETLFFVSVVILFKLCFKSYASYFQIGFDIIYSFYLIAIFVYFKYYGSILTLSAVGQANQLYSVRDSVNQLIDKRMLLFFVDILIFIIWKVLENKKKSNFSKKFVIGTIGIIVLCIANNSYQIYNNKNNNNELARANDVGFIDYQIANFVNKAFASDFSKMKITPSNVEQLKGVTNTTNQFTGIAKGKNVLIVQIEALQNFPIGLTINGKEITPNLNKLIKDSIYFPKVFQQIGKGNTVDAEFMSNTSIYPNAQEPMSNAVAGKTIPSMPRLMNNLGYQTSTFHTNEVHFWDRIDLYPALGWKKYFDQKYFGKQDIVSMGASDEVLYQKGVEQLKKYNDNHQKFYAQFVTLSSHYPFIIPQSKWNNIILLPTELQGTFVGQYIQAVNYADYSFGKLVEELKRDNLYNDTIIAVYGDHKGLALQNDKDTKAIQYVLNRPYKEYKDEFNIPFILKVPNAPKNIKVNTVGGQIDIMPTIANVLGVSLKNQVHFGEDLLNEHPHSFGIRFYAPTGTVVTNDYMYVPGATESDTKFYQFNKNKNSSNDKQKTSQHVQRLMFLSDEYIQNLK